MATMNNFFSELPSIAAGAIASSLLAAGLFFVADALMPKKASSQIRCSHDTNLSFQPAGNLRLFIGEVMK